MMQLAFSDNFMLTLSSDQFVFKYIIISLKRPSDRINFEDSADFNIHLLLIACPFVLQYI